MTKDVDEPSRVPQTEAYRCNECSQEFYTLKGLGAHRKKHRPGVKCKICGKTFKQIDRHLRIHEGERPLPLLSEQLIELAVRAEILEQQQLQGEKDD